LANITLNLDFMPLRTFGAITALLLSYACFSQNTGCPNVDLSSNTFSNWTGYTGTYAAPGANFGIVNGRHTIISQQGTDPYTCNQLPLIPPGHSKSIKLGNPQTGAQAEKIVYSINVTPQSDLFVYKYAVILENPGHVPAQQPKFQAKILNALGLPVGGGCGTYTVYGGQPGQNFQTCAGKTWLPWTTVGVDLSPYMGQNIQIEFTTWDCAQGAHFGYAYLAAECMAMAINVNYCGGNQPLVLTAPSGFQSYVWQPGNLTGQQVSIANPNVNQVYTCSMTTFSNQGSCTVELNVQATPTLVQSGFTYAIGCENAVIPLQSTAAVTSSNSSITLSNAWQTITGNIISQNNAQASVQFNGPGNHQVMMISQSSNGCVDTVIQTVSVLATPHLAPVFSVPCIHQQTNFNLSSASGVQGAVWDFGDGSPNAAGFNVEHTYSSPGTYTVTLIEIGNNGCSDTLISPLTIYPLPSINAGNDTNLCPGNSVVLLATGGVSYQWEQGLSQQQAYHPSMNEWLTVVGTDSLNCIASDSLYLGIFTVDSVQAMPNTAFCFGDSVELQANNAAGLWWENGLQPGQWVSPNVGNNVYVVHGSDQNGCTSTDTLTLTVFSLPMVDAGNDTVVCSGNSTFLNATGAASYQWSNQSANGSQLPIFNNVDLVVIGTDNNGCQQSDQLHIGIDSIPQLSFDISPSSGCAPLEVQLISQATGNTFIDYSWNFSNGAMTNGDSSVVWFNHVGCYDAQFTVMTSLGCTYSMSQANAVCTFPVPVAAFNILGQNLTTVYNGATLSNQSQGANSYMWDFGDGSLSSNEVHPYHEFPVIEGDNYVIHLIATNAYGCTDTAFQEIVVTDELAFYIPNAFTPDGDQFNNVWKPVFSDVNDPQNYRAMIYNRWGEVIWESYNPHVGWDGTIGSQGIPVQDDIYIYEVSFGYKTNAKKERITGHIAVIR
jgi:gliding motility-associated-like protein